VNDTAGYERHTRPRSMVSCHTAVVNGYMMRDMFQLRYQTLLNERPKGVGLAVPGMPVDLLEWRRLNSEAFSFLIFEESGHGSIYARYPAR